MPEKIARSWLASAAAALFALCPQSAFASAPAFSEHGPLNSDAGYFMVSWHADGPVTLEMQDASSASGVSEIYSGTNEAIFLTGLRDGEYHLFLKDAKGVSAGMLTLIVEHQSLSRALWLVALGALAFVATVYVILRGVRDE